MAGGTLVMIGLFIRPTAFIYSSTMAATYWMAYGINDFSRLLIEVNWRRGSALRFYIYCCARR
jgi:uncharacterized membrane protein YphA (DoxX/SURF4 family)